MKKIWFLLAVFGFISMLFWQISCATRQAKIEDSQRNKVEAEKILFLGDRHKEKGVECNGCHKGEPFEEGVPKAVCLSCHKDFSQGEKPIEMGEIDPHNSHMAISECNTCHHAHKASEDQCKSCHDFGFKIP